MSLWRIGSDTPHYQADDLSGKGAEKSGGRWNRAGTPMIYSATTRALACLETVVHLAKTPLPLNRFLIEIKVPSALFANAITLARTTLVGWDAQPAGQASVDWGTNWARSSTTALALVPSVIVPEEFNVLINPAHPDMRRVRSSRIRRWSYDARLA